MPKKTKKEENTAVIKLPSSPFNVLPLIKDTFRDFFSHKKVWVRLGAVPFVLSVVASFIASYNLSLGFLEGGSDLLLADQMAAWRRASGGLFWFLCWNYIWAVGGRHLLPEGHSSEFRWSVYGKLCLYKIFGIGILLASFALAAIPAGIIFSLVLAGVLSKPFLGISLVLILVGAFVACYVVGRILLFAPAIVSHRPHPFRVSWHLTKGHVFKLLVGYLSTQVLLSFVYFIFLGCVFLFVRLTPELWISLPESVRALGLALLGGVVTILILVFPIIYTSKAFKKLDQLYSLHLPLRKEKN